MMAMALLIKSILKGCNGKKLLGFIQHQYTKAIDCHGNLLSAPVMCAADICLTPNFEPQIGKFHGLVAFPFVSFFAG